MRDLSYKIHNANLMYLDKPVLNFNFSIYNRGMFVSEITKIYNENLIPLPCRSDIVSFPDWYLYRCFGEVSPRYNKLIYSLSGMPKDNFNRIYGAQTGTSLFSYGANLTDKYWINPEKSIMYYNDIAELTSFLDEKVIKPSAYKKINFFDNKHISDNFGKVVTEELPVDTEITDFRTPDICTDGFSHRRWRLYNDRYSLFKILYRDYEMEFYKKFYDDINAINPKILPELSYSKLQMAKREILAVNSECVTDKNTELISVYDIATYNLTRGYTLPDCIKKNYKELGFNMSAFEELEETIIKYEERTGNKSQKLENYGFLKDCNTGKIIRPVIWSRLSDIHFS